MERIALPVLILLGTIAPVFGQLVFQKNIGGPQNDHGFSLIAESDHTYFIIGNTMSYGTQGGEEDAIYLKTDVSGFVTWSNTYGIVGKRERARGISKTTDGGYLISGDHREGGANDDKYVHKLDAAGNQLNLFYYGTFAGDDELMSGMQVPFTNFYCLFGFTNSYGSGNADAYYKIINSDGTNNTSRYLGAGGDDRAYDGFHTGTSVVLAGETYSIGAGDADGLVAAYNAFNNLSWQRTIGGTGLDRFNSIKPTPAAGGSIAVGYTTSFGAVGEDIYVVKLTATGVISWARRIGGNGHEQALSVVVAPDGGYIIAGFTGSAGAGQNDAVLIKLDASGNLVWGKTYGGTQMERFQSVVARPDNMGFAAVGETNSFTNGGYDIYLVATDLNGNSGCNQASWSPVNVDITASLTVTTSGLSTTTLGHNVPPLSFTQGTASPPTSCICTGALPNLEIQGPAIVCRNQAGLNYYVNQIRGVTTYTWTVNGLPVVPNAGDTAITIASGVSDMQIIVRTGFGNCSDFYIDTIDVTVDQISVSISTGDDMLCVGDNTMLNTNVTGNVGGVNYAWTPGGDLTSSVVVSPASNTIYTVTVTDAQNCTATDAISISVFNYPVVSLGNDTLYCTMPSAMLDAGNAGAGYVWSTAAVSQTINVSNTDTFWVDVTVDGCTTRDSIALAFGATPDISFAVADDTLCIGDATDIIASAVNGDSPYSYSWSDGLGTNATINVNPSAHEYYAVTVTEANGCSNMDSVLIYVFAYPSVNLGNDTIQCGSAGPVLLDAQNAGGIFAWNTGESSQTISVSTTSTYWVDVTLNSCTTRDTIFVAYSNNPVVSITGDSAICKGEITQLAGSAIDGIQPYNYSWTGGMTDAVVDVSPPVTTTLQLAVTDSVGCIGITDILVEVTDYPAVFLGNDTVICFSPSLLLDAGNPGLSFEWQDLTTDQTFDATFTAWYYVDVTDNECTTRDSIFISFDSPPVADLGPDLWICEDELVTLDASNLNAAYNWSSGESSATISAGVGEYWVEVAKCYTAVYDTIILRLDTFSVSLLATVEPFCNASNGAITVVPSGGFADYNYTWDGFADSTATLGNLSAGEYTVTVTDAEGCTASRTVELTCSAPDIIITQLLTPNNDGKNDTWVVENINDFPNNVVVVYNRWGNEVFRATGYLNDWDGTPNTGPVIGSNRLPVGTYFYSIDVRGDGTDMRTGFIELQ